MKTLEEVFKGCIQRKYYVYDGRGYYSSGNFLRVLSCIERSAAIFKELLFISNNLFLLFFFN